MHTVLFKDLMLEIIVVVQNRYGGGGGAGGKRRFSLVIQVLECGVTKFWQDSAAGGGGSSPGGPACTLVERAAGDGSGSGGNRQLIRDRRWLMRQEMLTLDPGVFWYEQ